MMQAMPEDPHDGQTLAPTLTRSGPAALVRRSRLSRPWVGDPTTPAARSHSDPLARAETPQPHRGNYPPHQDG